MSGNHTPKYQHFYLWTVCDDRTFSIFYLFRLAVSQVHTMINFIEMVWEWDVHRRLTSFNWSHGVRYKWFQANKLRVKQIKPCKIFANINIRNSRKKTCYFYCQCPVIINFFPEADLGPLQHLTKSLPLWQ